MLHIQLHFYRGVYAASSGTPREVPEYPAHPLRLYAALIGTAHALGRTEHLAALRQLEQLKPPTIIAGATVETTENDVNHYVPCVPLAQGKTRSDFILGDYKMKKRCPRSRMADPRIIYVWDVSPSDDLVRALDDLLPEITHIGSGESLVEARRVQLDGFGIAPIDFSGLEWQYTPDAGNGDMLIRVPADGLMKRFDEAYARGGHLDSYPTHRYRRWDRNSTEGRESPWRLSYRFRLRGAAFHLEQALPLIEAFRGTLLTLSSREEMPSVLHGHGHKGKHHVAFMPLAFVGSRHADGRIKGIGVAVPRDADADDREVIASFMHRLDGLDVRVRADSTQLSLMDRGERGMVSLQQSTWTSPSNTWVSVTPIALDDWPGDDVGGVVAKSCVRAGLPLPERIEFVRTSMAGAAVPHSGRFRGIAQRCPPKSPAVWGHACIRWRDPVKGPLLLGRLRHFGIGLMMPVLPHEETRP